MILQSSNLKKYPEIIHGFTTRELGSDYPRIAQKLEIDVSSIFTLKQLHSNIVVIPASRRNQERGSKSGFPPSIVASRPRGGNDNSTEGVEGDALITHQPGIYLGIRTADCVPILVYDPKGGAVAAIHAGWRGVVAGVVENALEEMKHSFGSKPVHLVVALGTSLCAGCFEVGFEVAEVFEKKFGGELVITRVESGKAFFDLREACRLVLKRGGVLEEKIENLPYCTKCRPDLFYSHRGGDKGRMLGFIGLS